MTTRDDRDQVAVIAAMPGNESTARNVAGHLGTISADVSVHTFPDGESLVRAPPVGNTVILFCTLDRPNAKLVDLVLAAAALRERGARRLILVAPYLCYMRQDRAFNAGEAVSQQVIGSLLAARFDRIVTVDPHLHRTPRLDQVFPGIESCALSAAPVLAEMIASDWPESARAGVLVGPDEESKPWVAAVAARLGWRATVARKHRAGDRAVSVNFATSKESGDQSDLSIVVGRPAVLVDDVVASGATLAACARALIAAGASQVEAVAVHALCSDDDVAALRQAGINRLRSTDSVAHSTNAVSLAVLLADALRSEVAT